MELVAIPGQSPRGKVYLIGAGPGDPELLTMKAWRCLQLADVVLYDALVSAEILALAPEGAEMIAVGKRAGKHSAHQDDINQLLVTKGFTRNRVVRLKGGDPFIFGRGGEELQSLVEAGIPFEVVPGITAASGAAAYAGIPLTHRDCAQSVSFVTGHCKLKSEPLNWRQYADTNQTLVVYMGTLNAGIISRGLIDAGRAADTPVAIVSKASTPAQMVMTATLASLPELAASSELEMPALIIIGEVVRYTEQMNWFAQQQESQSKLQQYR
ncbi:uroporphyrinogen-III C-methyltransferase [Shewanella corallii]|uniref:uroporphyrinogen-III C-methyltransferase n=1 Tax=Shewanella corallii TaxID=560080 RepID=A0ABT0N2Z0_9GAMM|nr:uroporphyrinogen-III C-methyltransferase [Shewanella corallii]MCL2912705.1 uroporphyrinogen-III C-methyltransferase [Shewanella corallii]